MFFFMSIFDRTRNNGLKLQEETFQLENLAIIDSEKYCEDDGSASSAF